MINYFYAGQLIEGQHENIATVVNAVRQDNNHWHVWIVWKSDLNETVFYSTKDSGDWYEMNQWSEIPHNRSLAYGDQIDDDPSWLVSAVTVGDVKYVYPGADTSPEAMAFYAQRMTDLAGYNDWYSEALREAIEEYNAD